MKGLVFVATLMLAWAGCDRAEREVDPDWKERQDEMEMPQEELDEQQQQEERERMSDNRLQMGG